MIRQVLVQIRRLFGSAESRGTAHASDRRRQERGTVQVNNIQRGDMVGFPAEEVRPVALLPETETFHFSAGIAHRGEAVGRVFEVVGDQIVHVCADDLVCVNEDDFVQGEGEEDVEEEDFVAPDFALFFVLGAEPVWPFVGDHFVGEVVFAREVRGGRR